VIDIPSTNILNSTYLPNSGPTRGNSWNMGTTAIKPQNANQGNASYPVYYSRTSDPAVTIGNCTNDNSGLICSDGNANVILGNITSTWYIPAYARPSSFALGGGLYDKNMAIIQPDGRELDLYRCLPSRDWQSGDSIQGLCGNGVGVVLAADITRDKGINTGNINGGDNFSALLVRLNEIIQGQVNHAVASSAGCTQGHVYPAPFDAYNCSQAGHSGGIPAGARLWLSWDHATIDSKTSIPVQWRPIVYAMHDYGWYVFDTGGTDQAMNAIGLEDLLGQVLVPGGPAHTSWCDWSCNQGSPWPCGAGTACAWGDGNIYFNDPPSIGLDLSQFAGAMKVLDPCYAVGNCPDSIPPPTGGGTPPTIAITSPATTGSFATANATLTTLAGTASVTAPATISQLAWTCTGCVQPSGTITPGTNWSVASIGLNAGVQTITVTVTDSNNLTAAAAIAVTRTTTTTNNPPKGTFLYWRSLAARE